MPNGIASPQRNSTCVEDTSFKQFEALLERVLGLYKHALFPRREEIKTYVVEFVRLMLAEERLRMADGYVKVEKETAV